MIFNIFLIIISLGIVIFVHELGHFFVAKLSGVEIEKFSIGFGPEIFGFNKGNTRYCLSFIPFGGYVKMKGDDLNLEKIGPGDFMNLHWFKRILVVFAGPFMNYLFASLVFIGIIFSVGVYQIDNAPFIGSILKDMPAESVGLKTDDKILYINESKVNLWKDISIILENNQDKQINIVIEREGKELSFDIKPKYDDYNKNYLMGIGPKKILQKINFIKSIGYGFAYVSSLLVFFVKSIFLIISGKLKAEVMGPVGVIHSLSVAAHSGWLDFFNLIGIISLNLFVVNLLPIPILDGGHIVIFSIEGIRRKKISPKILQIFQLIGFLFIIFLIIFITQKDIFRILLSKG